MLDVDPANPQVPVMAKHVADKLKQRTWFNTQESSFGLLAIGKIARAAAKATITADIRVNGKTIGKSNGAGFETRCGPVKGDEY